MIPNWVSEGSVRKYHRAVSQLKKENKDITEATVRELYIKYGGLVLEVPQEAEVEKITKRRKAE